MVLSLRARLTVWYSVLLLVSVALLSGTVFMLDWHILVRQADESFDTLSLAAVNIIHDELVEHDNLATTRETEAVVQRAQFVVDAFDAHGGLVSTVTRPLDSAATDDTTDPYARAT